MQTTIGSYDEATHTVEVTFEHGGITHRRAVNACHTDLGAYDAAATAARVADVARGVVIKIELGTIIAPPEQTESQE